MNDLQPQSPQSGGVRELVERMSVELDNGVLPAAIFNDADVYAAEIDKIFGHEWIFLAHESELPEPGDYVLRHVVEDPFIVARTESGDISVLFDACRHRAAQLCRADKGNTSHFRCPYHGWVYNNNGDLVAVPARMQAYPGLDLSQWGLLKPARVESYRGLIFVNLDAAAPSLEDYLGDFRWYLDLHLNLTPGGMVVVGDPHRWRIDADWKSGADNFSGDSYHTQSAHKSIAETGLASSAAAGAAGGANDVHVTECSGHSTSIRRTDPGVVQFWSYPKELHDVIRSSDLSPEQLDLVERSVVHTGNIFPNLSFIHIGATDDPAEPPSAFFSIRQWQPRGPGQMEALSWVLVPREASEEARRRAHKVAVANFSPSGNFEQDDTIIWTGVSRAARGNFAARSGMMLNYQMGLEGMSKARPLNDWAGPGTVYDTNLEEGVQRTFYRHWLAAMGRES